MRQLFASFAALVLMLCLTSAALAHAALIASTPGQNEVVATAPAAFTLDFNEAVSPLVLTLVSPDASRNDLTDFTLTGTSLSIVAPADLGSGTFVLSYRVVSEDGHPVAGSVVFSIGAPTGEADQAGQVTDWPLRTAIWLGKLALYAGLFFGIGGLLFRIWLAPEVSSGRIFVRSALLAGLVAAPVSVGLQGLDAMGLPLEAILRGDIWAIGAATSLGPSAAIAFVALLVAVQADRATPAAARALSLLAFLGIGFSLAVTGHASAADPQWLTRPAVFLHALGIAFWAGALVPLWQLLRSGSPEARIALRRFSRIIPIALLPLIVAGVVLAVIQLGSVAALIETAYGRVLLIKLALLLAVFCLAAFNRWRLTRPVERGEAWAMQRLIRVIVVETLLIFSVMGVAALWRFTPPPRTLALQASPPLLLHIHSDKAMAQITFASDRVGSSAAEIVLMDGGFEPLDAQGLTVVVSKPDAGIEPVKYPAEKQVDGSWRVSAILFPVAGLWSVQLDIRVSDFELLKIGEEVTLAK